MEEWKVEHPRVFLVSKSFRMYIPLWNLALFLPAFFFFKSYYFSYVYVLGDLGDHKRSLHSLELELQGLVCHVRVLGFKVWSSVRVAKAFYLLSHFPRPCSLFGLSACPPTHVPTQSRLSLWDLLTSLGAVSESLPLPVSSTSSAQQLFCMFKD